MTGLDLMTERELLARLHQLADECESLDRRIAHARQRQRFSTNPREAAEALDEEKRLLVEMNWLMDRRRAVEGHLLRVRGRLRPLEP
jgi:hypothetical protein